MIKDSNEQPDDEEVHKARSRRVPNVRAVPVQLECTSSQHTEPSNLGVFLGGFHHIGMIIKSISSFSLLPGR